MSDFAESGTHCESSTDSKDLATRPIPENPTLEQRVEASLYLVGLGIRGSLEDVAYRLTCELAQSRLANKQMHDMMSAEIARLRARWSFDRTLANDSLEEVDDLEQQVILLREESGFNLEALITCQERLDNCLSMMDDLASYINWEEMTRA